MNRLLIPLTILYESEEGEIDGITRLQKLVFLVQEEGDIDREYDFRPKHYGPHSNPLYDDIDRLVDEGFVEQKQVEMGGRVGNDKQIYRITEDGRQIVEHAANGGDKLDIPEGLRDTIREIVGEYEHVSLYDMLKQVYSEYPETAQNSKLNI